ncbi:MAG: type II toxin-antitoxin system HicB family antitoxin [Gemmataceae bacterium]
MTFPVELELEDDGRWIAEVVELPGVIAYGPTPEVATANAKKLAFEVICDLIPPMSFLADENGELKKDFPWEVVIKRAGDRWGRK